MYETALGHKSLSLNLSLLLKKLNMIPLRGLKIGVLKSSMLTSVKLLKSRQAHVGIELQITAEVSKINRMKYGFNYKLWVFPQSVFGRLLLSLVQMIPPFFFFLYLWHFPLWSR